MTQYSIHERFVTWQGEGVHMGRKAFFIRTLGCPVKCPFCDSAGTWHPKWIPKEKDLMSVERLVQEAVESDSDFIVVTGGEPTIFDLTPLTSAAHAAGLKIHLETSGAFPIRGNFNWITVSPKRWKPLCAQAAGLADEFKFIIQQPSDIRFYFAMVEKALNPRPFSREVWLHPEWSAHEDEKVLAAINDAVVGRAFGFGMFRAGFQLHKLYRVDARDPRTKKLVPLGGIPKNGY